MKIAFHPGYDIGFPGIEALHPFDTRKYGKARRLIEGAVGAAALGDAALPVDRAVSAEEIGLVHTAAYLDSLRTAKVVADIVEVPQARLAPGMLLDRVLLRPMRLAVRGTALAAAAALREGLAVNLAGGYHHAKPDRGEGFCVYNDIAIAVAGLRADGRLAAADRILYVDVDAHLGNGCGHSFLHDERVVIVDAYNAWAYPLNDQVARDRVDFPVQLDHGTGDAAYLEAVRLAVRDALARGSYALAVVNAGTDVHLDDWVGGLGVSAAGIFERDRMIVSELRGRAIPTLFLPSGGYTPASCRYLARSVAWMLTGRDLAPAVGLGPAGHAAEPGLAPGAGPPPR